MIDHGEVDYKCVVVQKGSELDGRYNCVTEMAQSEHRHILSGVREWFRWYKFEDGKLNQFENDEQYLPHQESMQLVAESHGQWQAFYNKQKDNVIQWVKNNLKSID
eukprot:Mrub_08957.p4 GENE.Mrub_08957~~Mrub_08957.p4  ORF type:complete len:106 (-),score=38.73 Mrub_08957:13-330(-)